MARDYPKEMTPELREILGMMIFNSGPLAHAFRAAGYDIKPRAEDEQAFILHWLIGLALEHGAEWKRHAADALDALKPISVKTA